MSKITDRQMHKVWEEFRENLMKATPVDLTESTLERQRRVEKLEKDDEAWFQYYFPNYYLSEPAPFQKRSTRMVMRNMEYYIVRAWSRELAKSTRTMMEVLKLVLTGKKKNVILTSYSADNAERLITPFKIKLESNNRIINDYGKQEKVGQWEANHFVTRKGTSFLALGAGQSPRGTRNEAIRPDVLLVDDMDTDEDVRNPEIIDKRWNWIEQALIPTRSISGSLLIIFCGNIIAEDSCITRAMKKADKVEVVNIRDESGKSTWPQKNTEEMIDRVLSTISYASQQKEYFNNPVSEGKTFKEITWGKVPRLDHYDYVLQYADPATFNKDKPSKRSGVQNSMKGTVLLGFKDGFYYVITAFLDHMSQADFVKYLYEIRERVGSKNVLYSYIENNSLQDPFYTQILEFLIYKEGREEHDGKVLAITPDDRKKPQKWFRIEADLEPLVRTGRLIFNIAEKENPHMERLETQFLTAHPNSTLLDGPDMVQGAFKIIEEKNAMITAGGITIIERKGNKKGY